MNNTSRFGDSNRLFARGLLATCVALAAACSGTDNVNTTDTGIADTRRPDVATVEDVASPTDIVSAPDVAGDSGIPEDVASPMDVPDPIDVADPPDVMVADVMVADVRPDTRPACTMGMTCASTTQCRTATIDCSSGTPVCMDTGNAAVGSTCMRAGGAAGRCSAAGNCV